MSAPSGGWFVTKHPQYVEETQFGVMPTNPDLNWIGPAESWDPRSDIPPYEVRYLGSEDPHSLLRGIEAYEFTLEHFMQASTWAKYAINPQGGGAGSIDKSLALACGIRMGGAAGTVYYYTMLGCRARSLTLTGRPGEAHRLRMEVVTRQIPEPGTSDPVGTGSWASDPATPPWFFTSGGQDPIEVGGAPVPVTEISITIERNPEVIYVMGSGLAEYIPPKHRSIKGTMTLVWLSQNRYADLQNYTNRNVVWTLNTAPSSILTMSNCKFHRLDSFTIRPTEVVFERWSFTGLNATLT
jgi:hypothetical protein